MDLKGSSHDNMLLRFLRLLRVPTLERIDETFIKPSSLDAARYLFARSFVKGAVLDAGCGCGYGVNILTRNKHVRVVLGIDVSKYAVSVAKSLVKAPNAQFMVADALQLAFRESSFDAVISLEVIEHVDDPQKYLQEICRVLKTHGTCVVSTPNYTFYSIDKVRDPFHLREFGLEEFRRLLEGHLENIHMYGQVIRNKALLKRLLEHDKKMRRMSKIIPGLIRRLIPIRYKDLMPLKIRNLILGKEPTIELDDMEITDNTNKLWSSHGFIAVGSKSDSAQGSNSYTRTR